MTAKPIATAPASAAYVRSSRDRKHNPQTSVSSRKSLQSSGAHRAGHRRTQALQAHRPSMRKNHAQLLFPRRSRSRLHLDQIRPLRLGRDLAADFKERFSLALDEEGLNASHQIVVVAPEIDESTSRIVNYLNDRDIPINVPVLEQQRDGLAVDRRGLIGAARHWTAR